MTQATTINSPKLQPLFDTMDSEESNSSYSIDSNDDDDISSVNTDYSDLDVYNDCYADNDHEDGVRNGMYAFPRNIDIDLSYDDTDEYLLQRGKEEFNKVAENIKTLLKTKNLRSDSQPSPLILFELFFPEHLMQALLLWIDHYSISTNKMDITMKDVFAFIRLDLKIQFFKTSPTHLFHDKQKQRYNLGGYMKQRTYKYVMVALNNGRKKTKALVSGTVRSIATMKLIHYLSRLGKDVHESVLSLGYL